MFSIIVIILLSYLLGSIPTSVWVGRLYKKVDIRHYGSGNPGATNVFRILGWKAGVIVALIDLAKGFIAAYFICNLGYVIGDIPSHVGIWNTHIFLQIIAGLSAVLGHMFPLYAHFKGGKGVITAAGALYAIEPWSISAAILVFLIVLLITHYVSFASITAAFIYPFVMLFMRYVLLIHLDGSQIIFASVLAVGIIVKHLQNIRRLLSGNENRVRSFRPAKGWLNKEKAS